MHSSRVALSGCSVDATGIHCVLYKTWPIPRESTSEIKWRHQDGLGLLNHYIFFSRERHSGLIHLDSGTSHLLVVAAPLCPTLIPSALKVYWNLGSKYTCSLVWGFLSSVHGMGRSVGELDSLEAILVSDKQDSKDGCLNIPVLQVGQGAFPTVSEGPSRTNSLSLPAAVTCSLLPSALGLSFLTPSPLKSLPQSLLLGQKPAEDIRMRPFGFV